MAVSNWQQTFKLEPKKFACGHCGVLVGSDTGYHKVTSPERIYFCPACERPTYFHGDHQVPGVAFGNPVEHLPPPVAGLYAESRNCMAVSAYTASVLACRKLLMNVAVHVGAGQNRHFVEYVNYLAEEGYVPPTGKGWVDHIRRKGNEATHEIPAMTRSDAEDILSFMEMILKLVFEFPNRVPGHGSGPAQVAGGATQPP